MAATTLPLTARLGASTVVLVECSKGIDHQRGSSCGGLGFIVERPPVGRRVVGTLSAVSVPLLSSYSSRSSRCATVFAAKQKSRAEDDDGPDDEATEFADMGEWMRNKPAGFGLTEYDTSLEERLLVEIEAEKAKRTAVASKKKVKKSGKAVGKLDTLPQGVEVYVGNLPRKRNVDRDLRAAFRSAHGLLHIRPVVDGNEKTREPMCKGLAFLTFASDSEAKEFIRRYNGVEVRFGKADKEVVCELASVNSPFKKEVSQKQSMDSSQLQIRERSSSPPILTPPSSQVAVEIADRREFSAAESSSKETPSKLNSENLEGGEEDVDLLDLSVDEQLELEQEIWAELEDEDDFELDRELEGSDTEDSDDVLPVEKVCGLDGSNDIAQDTQVDALGSDPTHIHSTENDALVEDKDADIQEAEGSRGRGFGLAPNSLPDAAAAGDKDKRIRELEFKLKALEVKLKKRETKEKFTGERTSQSEEKIEALEKRLLARARPAPEKDSKIKTSKRATGSKKSSSQKNLSRPKIGGASKRLKKKERQIYTGVLAKYSPLVEKVAA